MHASFETTAREQGFGTDLDQNSGRKLQFGFEDLFCDIIGPIIGIFSSKIEKCLCSIGKAIDALIPPWNLGKIFDFLSINVLEGDFGLEEESSNNGDSDFDLR